MQIKTTVRYHFWYQFELIANEVDKPRVYYTDEVNQKQISNPNAYLWNLERWQWWTYLQGSNRDTDIESKLEDKAGEGEGGANGESIKEAYAISYVK